MPAVLSFFGFFILGLVLLPSCSHITSREVAPATEESSKNGQLKVSTAKCLEVKSGSQFPPSVAEELSATISSQKVPLSFFEVVLTRESPESFKDSNATVQIPILIISGRPPCYVSHGGRINYTPLFPAGLAVYSHGFANRVGGFALSTAKDLEGVFAWKFYEPAESNEYHLFVSGDPEQLKSFFNQIESNGMLITHACEQVP